MIDVVLGAGIFEGVRPNRLPSVGSVVSEDRVDLVGDGGDQAAQEVPRGAARHFLVQLDEGEL